MALRFALRRFFFQRAAALGQLGFEPRQFIQLLGYVAFQRIEFGFSFFILGKIRFGVKIVVGQVQRSLRQVCFLL